MTRLGRRWLAAGIIAAVGFGDSLAGAAAPSIEVGSWWSFQSDDETVPAPPHVMARAPWVASGPLGPTAISAVRIRLAAGRASPLLTMRVVSEQPAGFAGFIACVATSTWSPATAGRWSARPSWDCGAGYASGQLAIDRSSASIDLGSLQRGDRVDVVLLPTSSLELPASAPATPAPALSPSLPVTPYPVFDLAFAPLAEDAVMLAQVSVSAATAAPPRSTPVTLTPAVDVRPLVPGVAGATAGRRDQPVGLGAPTRRGSALPARRVTDWQAGRDRWIAAVALMMLAAWSVLEWRTTRRASAVASDGAVSGPAPPLR